LPHTCWRLEFTRIRRGIALIDGKDGRNRPTPPCFAKQSY
jgi:hypothetical protein